MNLEMVRRFERLMSAETASYQVALDTTSGKTWQAVSHAVRNGTITTKATRAVKAEMSALKTSADEINARYGPEFAKLAAEFTKAQLEMARGVDPRVVSFEEVEAAAEATVKRILRQMFTGEVSWPEAGRLKLLVEMNRLSGSGEDPRAIYERLLAMELQSGRASVWRSMTNSMSLESDRSAWDLTMSLVQIYLERAEKLSAPKQDWEKQAAATIGERTTDCCLTVHGQIQPLSKPFHLTGTPRYADWIHHSPFHWYCRTSIVLYLPEFEEIGISTQEMRDAARAEIEAREKTGKREEIHPADVVSRRA